MKVVAVIHKSEVPGEYLDYEVLLKRGIFDKLFGKTYQLPRKFEWDYKTESSFTRKYVKRGYEYLMSGTTDHISDVLKKMGLSDPKDVEGLKKFLSKVYEPKEILVEL